MTGFETAAARFLAGGGELGARMRAFDWAATSLGAPDQWPQSLKTAVGIMLTSRQPIWIGWGPELTYLYNDPYKAIVGGKHPWALGRPTKEVWREIWDDIEPMLATAMTGVEGTYVESQLLIMERNGYPEETYYTFSYSPIANDDGSPGGIICANTDDTQRVIGERQLVLLRELAARTAEARTWNEACQASADALATNSRDMPFAMIYSLGADDTAATLVGVAGIARGHAAAPETLEPGEDRGWPIAEALRSQTSSVLADLRATFGSDLPRGAGQRAPASGAVFPIGASASGGRTAALIVGLNPFRLFDDAYRGFLSLVAGQIGAAMANAEAYAQQRQRAEALAELDRAKTQFFSNVSHEFRTPLTLMLGPLEDALNDDTKMSDIQRGRLVVAHRNSLRLLRLVNTLLDFSRIEAGRVEAVFEFTNLAATTADLASNFRSAIERAGLALRVDCPALPEPVLVDRDMWEKIVLNLLSNALKFTFVGEVAVTLSAAGEAAVLSVRDTGVGIPPAELPRLFDRFHRVEGQKSRSFEGSGIGLALVHELVKLHGGSIRADSEVGRGTEFTVTIPFGSAHLPADRIGVHGRDASPPMRAEAYVEEALRWLPEPGGPAGVVVAGPPVASPTARILLADDNADMRDYVRRLLSARWQVETVADGRAALDAIRARKPDLVLTDVMMPRLDGHGLLRNIRADPALRDLPVIMLSARAGEEARLEGLGVGADDYLTKPFSARELVARVNSNLVFARVRRDAEQSLRDQREQLYAVFMQAPVPICVFRGQELIFEMANPLYCEVAGRKELLGKTLHEAIPEARGQGFDELLRGVMKTGKAYVGKEMLVRLDRDHDGATEDTYFTFIYSPVFNERGTADRVIAVVNDVTDQVVARQRIEASEEKFRRIVMQMRAGIAQTDLTGRFTLTNTRYQEIVGRSAEELLLLRLQDITHPDDRVGNLTEILQVLDDAAPFASEQRYVRPNGSAVWVQSSISRIDDAGGSAQGISVISIDIAGRRAAELASGKPSAIAQEGDNAHATS